jgi:hypothetical protein
MNTTTSNPTKHVPFTIKGDGNISMYYNGESYSIASDHPNYNKIVDKLKKYDFAGLGELIDVSKAIIKYARGKIQIVNGEILYNGYSVHNTLTTRIMKMMEEGFRFDHMIAFLENLMKNPSNRAINETYRFLENYGLPITDDGCFLAYKAVRNNYTDIYSGKYDNSIGKSPEMPRGQVDDDYDRDCSKGLHVGALDYVIQYGHFTKGAEIPENGNRLLIVKINPQDVVSVPKYESHPKVRVCRYEVVSEITDVVKELEKVVYTSSGQAFESDYTDDGDYDDCDYDDCDDDCDYDGCDDDHDDDTDDTNTGCNNGGGCDCSTPDDEYEAGYSKGNHDFCIGIPPQYTDTNPVYDRGYSDGFYGREYKYN